MRIEKSVVIHQPNFLPWLGYFAKLVYAEKLIVLDNVLFSKRKHIDRVQIISAEGEIIWIGLPIGQNYQTPCNKIHFNDKKSLIKIVNTLNTSYSKAKHFKENIPFIEDIILNCTNESDILSEIDILISTKLMAHLNLSMPKIIRSSQFLESTFYGPTERIIYLCEKTKSNKIIVGSKEATEVHNIKQIGKFNISILLQDYLNKHPPYFQTRRTRLGFAKGLSIIDCIFNVGVIETSNLLKLKPENYGRG